MNLSSTDRRSSTSLRQDLTGKAGGKYLPSGLRQYGWIATLVMGLACLADTADGQRLRRAIGGDQTEHLPRRPNDQVEGTIWEYKSTEYQMPLAEGEVEETIEGRFRIEGTAVFDHKPFVEISGGEQRSETLKRLLGGEAMKLSVPSGPEQKRIGEFRKMDNGKTRFEFNDAEGLHGVMIAWPKEDANGVWLAIYYKKDGNRTVGKWAMELRAVED